MRESIYIPRSEFYAFMKDVKYLADQARAANSNKKPAAWITQREAMEMIGCAERTLRRLRISGELHWKTSGKGRGVMVHRESVEKYILNNSTLMATKSSKN